MIPLTEADMKAMAIKRRARFFPPARPVAKAITLESRPEFILRDYFHYRKPIGPKQPKGQFKSVPRLVYTPETTGSIEARLYAAARVARLDTTRFACQASEIVSEHWFEIVGKTKARSVTAKRAMIAHALHANGWSFCAIGRLIEKDHTSIMHLVRAWQPDGRRNPDFIPKPCKALKRRVKE